MIHFARLFLIFSTVAVVGCGFGGASGPESDDFDRWSNGEWMRPPKQFRPMIRWWWPGGDVTAEGITAELSLLDDLGFGGVEIQPFTFGLPPDKAAAPAVRSVGDASFVARLDHAFAEARRRGMRVDLTMSSGWGLGGELDCAECGTHQLLMTAFDISGPTDINLAIPRATSTPYEENPVVRLLGLGGPFDPGLELVAVVRGRLSEPSSDPTAGTAIVTELRDITADVQEERLRTRVPDGRFRMFAVFRNRTNTRLVGAAYPGDPAAFRTIDHLDQRGLAAFRRSYFDRLAEALAVPPDHYFVDSFEFVADVPWTPSFLEVFVEARGYDLRPYLPLIFNEGGEFSFVGSTPPRVAMDEVGSRVREDYVDVRAVRFMTEFIEPLRAAANEGGAGFRVQALGGYGDYLDVFAAVDIPEAEDFGLAGRSDFLRLASSAAHIAGHRTASNEAFVVNRGSSISLTEDEYLRLAGRAFAAGINQLVVHGRAYPTAEQPSARWYPFGGIATTRLDQTNPIWARLPHLTGTVARLSYALTRGRPLTQVAWVMTELRPPEFDQPAPSITAQGQGPYLETNPISRVLGQHGVGFDRVSRRALASSGRTCGERVCIGEGAYDLVLVDHAAVASIDWLDRIRELAVAGIPVVFVGPQAMRARGFSDAAARDAAVRDVMARLRRLPDFHAVPAAEDIGPILRTLTARGAIRPAEPQGWRFATTWRTLTTEHVLLVFNGTSSDDVALFEVLRPVEGTVLDPEDGSTVRRFTVDRGDHLRVNIPSGRSRVIRLSEAP